MRGAILAAAMKLFHEESFAKTTMRRIAQEIEYTPGALYSYFKDKDEILYELHQRGFDTLFAMQQPALAIADPVERLGRLGQIYMEFALANPEYYDLMFIASETGRSIEEAEDWHCGERAYGVVRDTMREIIDAGRLRGTSDPEIAAFAAWSSVHGIASLLIRGRCRIIPEEERERIVSGATQLLNAALIAPAPTPSSSPSPAKAKETAKR
ncbi:MAG TPA: TetR/AcrR family transcriptional regulator [Kofleriaceae bacterium]|nr:TetR/AcrR family transcriptional regulator [Kofleriaceae bacterium]